MRLDKFVGKASYSMKMKVYDNLDSNSIYPEFDGSDYLSLKEDMKKYKVEYYTIEEDCLLVYVEEKKND